MPRFVLAVLALLAAAPAVLAQNDAANRDSVVKIFSTIRGPNLTQPWTRQAPSEATGSGVIIAGNRILTNAHVVDYARRILVQPYQSADKYEATVVAVAHGIDLALLQLEDDAFFDTYPAAELSEDLPPIGRTVTALGYPIGGDALSITEGIVSRIEHTGYNNETLGLRIQVDVAINPGNSGGPVFMDGKVIGLVFAGVTQADNIGYVIPTEEVRMFLDDAADGSYNGSPRLFARLQTAENDALRAKLGLTREHTGLIVTDPGQTPGLLRWDLIDRIGDHDIDNAGMADLPAAAGLRLGFSYWIPKLATISQDGSGTVPVTVIRDGQSLDLQIPVAATRNPLVPPLLGGHPSYLIYGPIVFTAVSQELIQGLARAGFLLASNDSPLIERVTDAQEADEQLVVIPAPFFPHKLTKGYQAGVFPVLESVNGTKIRNLAHLTETLLAVDDEYTEFVFAGSANETMVFRTQELRQATEDVLEDAGIRAQASDDIAPLLR